MQQLSALGQFVGPPAVAWVAMHMGGWQFTWVVTGACSLLGLVVAVRLQREWLSSRGT
jgi:MFS transporter, CP family, cyanate transporter